MKYSLQILDPFWTNVPYMDKPCSWFLLAKCLKKHLWKSDILSSKNQLPGFYISGTLVENGLIT